MSRSTNGTRPADNLIARRDRGACGSPAAASGTVGVVSISRCREVLGSGADAWTDGDVLALREQLAYIADLAVDLANDPEREAA